MADKKVPETTAVAVPRQTAIAMPGSWRDQIKKVAVRVAEVEKPTSGFISFKGGRVSIGDNLMPGDKIECIVVDYLLHNKYFNTAYNSNKIVPPICYAFSRDVENLQPSEGDDDHPGPSDPQSDFCSNCPQNEWGSAGGGSRGKACTNSRRIWLLPADASQSLDKAGRSDLLQCDLPATSVGNFQKFINDAAAAGMAPFQFVVELAVRPHDKTLFQVYWKPLEQIKDESILEALANRNWSHEQEPFPIYPTKEEMEERSSGGGTGSNKY